MGNGNGTGVKSDARYAKRDTDATDDLGNQSDMSQGHRDMPGIHSGMNTTTDMTQTINTC